METYRLTKEASEYSATTLLEAVGMPPESARTAAAHMVLADLRGVETHGLIRLPLYVNRIRSGELEASAVPKLVEDGPTTAVVDGGHGLGHVNSDFAMREAISRAEQSGVGVVAVRDSSHFGAAAGYAAMAAEAGCIGIATTNVAPLMPPVGGAERRVGNNPLAVAAPSQEGFPLVLDIAMSTVAAWSIRMAAERGEEIPLEWAFDKDGEPTTDAYAAFQGGGLLRPLGDHKGFGLALMIDVLSGVLSGGGFGGEVKRLDQEGYLNTSHFFLAIEIRRFIGTEAFLDRIGRLVEEIRSTPTREGADRILVPGEKESETEQERRRNGIPYSQQIWAPISELARELKVDLEELPSDSGSRRTV